MPVNGRARRLFQTKDSKLDAWNIGEEVEDVKDKSSPWWNVVRLQPYLGLQIFGKTNRYKDNH
jgi:hypothetical protein